MYLELNKKLEEAQQKIYRLNKIDSILKELIKDESQIEDKIYELKTVLDKENLDVEELNRKNIISIFYSLTGKIQEKKEEEQREALAAKLKYDQANNDLEYIKTEISKLMEEKEEYKDCINEYKRLYAQKKELLIRSDGGSANKIIDISQKIEGSKRNLKELDEAISAGKAAVDSLDSALKSLGSAKGWGTWDLLGGGLISDFAKHSHIDNAMREVEQAHYQLRRFKSELADVKINYEIRFETDGFGKFADFFFDGLIADWYMQSKINNSYTSVSNVKNHVSSAIYRLEQLKEEETLNIEKLQNELNNVIIRS